MPPHPAKNMASLVLLDSQTQIFVTLSEFKLRTPDDWAKTYYSGAPYLLALLNIC